MPNETFNHDLRRFLKRFGVTAQQAIEEAVAQALEQGALGPQDTLPVRADLTVEALGIRIVIEDELRVGDDDTRD